MKSTPSVVKHKESIYFGEPIWKPTSEASNLGWSRVLRLLQLQEQLAVVQGPGKVRQPVLLCSIEDLRADVCRCLQVSRVEVGVGVQTSENLVVTSVGLQQLVRSRPDSKKCPTSWLPLCTVTFFRLPSGAWGRRVRCLRRINCRSAETFTNFFPAAISA